MVTRLKSLGKYSCGPVRMEVVIKQGLFYVFFIPSTQNNTGNSLEMEKCMLNQSNHGSGWTKREKKKKQLVESSGVGRLEKHKDPKETQKK